MIRPMVPASMLLVLLTGTAVAQSDGMGQAIGPETALLAIDIQNVYLDGGLVPLTGSLEAGERARQVLDAFRARRLPVIQVRHVPKTGAVLDGEPADPQCRIRPVVAPAAGETVITKRCANSFRETGPLGQLRQRKITRLVIVGMHTHVRVEAASRAAADLGFELTVVHDGCATRPPKFGGQNVPAARVHAAGLAAINGTYGHVVCVEQLLSSAR
jgi:nicotinamidase-related amidase